MLAHFWFWWLKCHKHFYSFIFVLFSIGTSCMRAVGSCCVWLNPSIYLILKANNRKHSCSLEARTSCFFSTYDAAIDNFPCTAKWLQFYLFLAKWASVRGLRIQIYSFRIWLFCSPQCFVLEKLVCCVRIVRMRWSTFVLGAMASCAMQADRQCAWSNEKNSNIHPKCITPRPYGHAITY